MADEMLRISGRGKDGKAKAIKTNDDGKLDVTFNDSNIINELVNEAISGSYVWLYSVNTPEDMGVTSFRQTISLRQPATGYLELVTYENVSSVLTSKIYHFEDQKIINPTWFADSPRHRVRIVLTDGTDNEILYAITFSEQTSNYDTNKVRELLESEKLVTQSGGNVKVLEQKKGVIIPQGGDEWLYSFPEVSNTRFNDAKIYLKLKESADFEIRVYEYNGEGLPSGSDVLSTQTHEYFGEDIVEEEISTKVPFHRARFFNRSTKDIEIEYFVVYGLTNSNTTKSSGGEGGTWDGIINGESKDGSQTKPLTYEEDDEGKAVLRVIDAAPYAYDPISNALKVNVTEKTNKLERIKIEETIEPGSHAILLSDFYAGEYEYVSCGVSPDASSPFRIELIQKDFEDDATLHVRGRSESPYTEEFNSFSSLTEEVKLQTDGINFVLRNQDVVVHSYTAYIYLRK